VKVYRRYILMEPLGGRGAVMLSLTKTIIRIKIVDYPIVLHAAAAWSAIAIIMSYVCLFVCDAVHVAKRYIISCSKSV